MNLTVEEKIKQNTEWDTAVYGATKLLEEMVRNSVARLATVDWTLVWYKDRFPGFLLKISDEVGGTAEMRFTLEELKDGHHLRDRLRRLWADVLSTSSKKLLAKLRQTVANLEED
ncbi:MAG: hypothetical protein K2R98_01990 [Gemmataceae bacterium]|nr:hypothetical protein [Gemmataceae bacterium]